MSRKSVNKVTLIGHLGADPELRVGANEGVPVTTVRVATTERWKDRHSGERKEQTEWHGWCVSGRWRNSWVII